MMEIHKNILWIDYAKFIGIFFVIWGHTIQKFYLLDLELFIFLWKYIYLFHMPLFFVIAGFLYKQKDQKSNLTKILFALIIPYFLYQLLYLPFSYGYYIIKTDLLNLTILKKCLLGIIIGDFVDSNYSLVVCGPCWFIISIIHIRLLLNFIQLNIKNIIVLTLTSVLILKILIFYNIDLFFCLDNTLMAIPYFMLGYCIKQIYNNTPLTKNFYLKSNYFVQKTKGIKTIILQIFLLISILFLILQYNGLIEINLKITESLQKQSLFLSYIGGITGTFLVFIISKLLKNKYNFVDIISKNTIFIIYFHFFLLFLLNWCKFHKLINLSSNLFLLFGISLITTTCILILSYYIIKLLNLYCPILLGKYKTQMK